MARFPTSQERWAREKATEREYTITPGGQKRELVKEPATPQEQAKREREIRRKQAKYAKAVQRQNEKIAQNYEGLTDHLEEIASGALVTDEDGPGYVEFDKPDVPEAEKLQRDYEKAKAQENSVAMARTKKRLAAVRELDEAQARELELARVLGDPVSDEAARESIEEEEVLESGEVYEYMGAYLVADTDGKQYEFDSLEEAEDFAEAVQEYK
jgi:hypothetical protein